MFSKFQNNILYSKTFIPRIPRAKKTLMEKCDENEEKLSILILSESEGNINVKLHQKFEDGNNKVDLNKILSSSEKELLKKSNILQQVTILDFYLTKN